MSFWFFQPIPGAGQALAPIVVTVYPVSDVTDGTWTDQAGGASLYAAIDETSADDADYIKSTMLTSGASDTCEVLLGSMTAPDVDTNHTVRYRYRAQGAATIDLTVSLRQGASTEIAAWTHNGVGSSFVDAAQSLTELQASNITDYSDLRLRFVASVA
jgi:hypothetical protein